MAEVVGGAFLGYAVTETLNRVLRTLKKIVAFPVECQKLRCRLLIIKPTVEEKEALSSVEEREALLIAIKTSAPAQGTAAPGSDHIEGLEHGMGVTGYSALTARVEWLKQVKGLLDEAEKVLEECDTVKIGRIPEPVKKHNLAGKLSKLKDRFNSVMLDGVLAVLIEVDGMVTDLMGTVNEMSKKMDESLEDTSEIRRMHEKYPKLLQETNKKIDEQLPLLQNLQGRSGAAAIPVEDPLASTLKALSVRTGRDKRCKVKLDICELTDIPPNRFRPPREIKPYAPEQASTSARLLMVAMK